MSDANKKPPSDEIIAELAEDARDTGRDTNTRVKKIEDGGHRNLFKRLALFATILLVIYLVVITFNQSRQNGEAVGAANQALEMLAGNNRTLTANNERLSELALRLSGERDALIRLNEAQSQRIRDLGGIPVDVFDPEVSGADPSGQRSDQVRPGSGTGSRPGEQPQASGNAPNSPSGGSNPTPAPQPSPEPSEDPEEPPGPLPFPLPVPIPPDEICVIEDIPCVPVPDRIVVPDTPLALSAASVADPLETTEDTVDFFNMDASTLSKLLGLLVPLLVGVFTKRYASSGLKSAINIGGSAIVGSLSYLVAADGGYDVRGFINAALNTVIVSVAAYYGLYKPTGISDTVQAKTADFGVGPKPDLETSDKVEGIEEVITEQNLDGVAEHAPAEPLVKGDSVVGPKKRKTRG